MKYFLYWWEYSKKLDLELYKLTNKVNPKITLKKIWKLIFWITKAWWLSIDWNIISVLWSNACIYKDWEIISYLSSWEKFYL